MNLLLTIYAIENLTPNDLFWIIMVCAGFLAFVFTAAMSESFKSVVKALSFKPVKYIWIAIAIFAVYGVLTPSKETAYKMLAAYGVEQVAENPDVKRLAGKSLQLLESTVDAYLSKEKKG